VSIYQNGRNINFLNSLDTQLHGEDKIAIFPPVAGG
jgi:molybdopterin converting factor small subunit